MTGWYEIKGSFASITRLLFCFLLLRSFFVCSQETNSHLSGMVRSERNEVLQNATVVVIHEPTRNTYYAQTNAYGYFHFFNMKPGGPYTITISYTGYELSSRTGLFLGYMATHFYSWLGDEELAVFFLREKNSTLGEVTLHSKQQGGRKFGTETSIDKEKINSLPSVSRNLQDYIRLVPNAGTNSDGGIGLAGQNNKYNIFFIDGSNVTDVLGLANSGTAGGQTNSPPVSIEALEEIKVLLSPYDAQYSNFTGGSINAITKSGSNQSKSALWYFFRNEKMAGRSPLPVAVPGLPDVMERPRLAHFFNQTMGTYNSGAIVNNKLFYFILLEYQTESQPQPFNFLEYKGNSTMQQLAALADTVQKRYGYVPGSFLDAANELNAKRFTAKLDWNPDARNKLTVSYRFNKGERTTPQAQNSSTLIRFSNNRYRLPSTIHSASFEWKTYFNNITNNRLLVTYNNEVTARKIIGQAFPHVILNDGPGIIMFGSNGSGQINRFAASELTLLDVFRFITKNQVFSAGADLHFTKIRDVALNGYFGQYRYANLNSFLTTGYPSRFARTYSLADKPVNAHTEAAAKYNPLRMGLFVNDEIQVNERLKLTAGIRIDANKLPLRYKEDRYFNTTARARIGEYYDLKGAISGKIMKPAWQLSPRIGFSYKIPAAGITIRGGAGIFTGHILNVWASQIYMANVAYINIPAGLFGLNFNPDPYNQPDLESLGIDPEMSKGGLVVVARNYKYPAVFRTSLGIDKRFFNNWNLTAELFFSKNIYENDYRNINILPPAKTSASPGSRDVYSVNANPDRIPMPGGNPYEYIFLLSNNSRKKGFSYGFISSANKSIGDGFWTIFSYCFEHSVALFEPGGNANTNDGQWKALETVNGKNNAGRSVSDFDLRHRISASIAKRIDYGKWSTRITLVYNGQSGSPFSYVYGGSMVNDDGNPPSVNADLIYIPTKKDLVSMVFVTSSDNAVPPQQQKELLDEYIEGDRYLRKHRGQFAERNAARLPFVHTVDLRLQQDVRIKLNKKETVISIIYDVFNFTNMLHRSWGRTYFLANDNYALITFAGFDNVNTLTPQYQFRPQNGKPWSVQNSTEPGSSARWISQLGIKISF